MHGIKTKQQIVLQKFFPKRVAIWYFLQAEHRKYLCTNLRGSDEINPGTGNGLVCNLKNFRGMYVN